MSIDLYAKAVNLLEQIANSVHERDPKNPNLLCFSTSEVQVVQEWLNQFKKEVWNESVTFELKPRVQAIK